MLPRAQARRASRVCRVGQERATVLHHHGGDRSEKRSPASPPPRSRGPESLHVLRARPAPARPGGGGVLQCPLGRPPPRPALAVILQRKLGAISPQPPALPPR